MGRIDIRNKLLVAFWLMLSLGALAVTASGPLRSGTLDNEGVQPWEACALCHSLDGISRMSRFPKLAGQKMPYVEKQLRDFRSGRRHNDGGQMAAVVTEITADQIPIVARYFSQLDPPPPVATENLPKSLRRGEDLFKRGDDGAGLQACQFCHQKQNDAEPGAPYITAQHPDYLAKQLREFRSGARGNDISGIMRAIASKLSDADIKALSAYIASQARQVKQATGSKIRQ